MLNVHSLRTSISQQQADANSKRHLAESLLKSAEDHERSGDAARAKLDRDSAQRYLDEAEQMEKSSSLLEMEIIRRRRKASQLEKEKQNIISQRDKEIEKLDREIQDLAG